MRLVKAALAALARRTLAKLTSPNKGQDEAGRRRPPPDLRKVMAGRPTSRLGPTPLKGRGRRGAPRLRSRKLPPPHPNPPQMMERDETKQTKRRSCDGHMRDSDPARRL